MSKAFERNKELHGIGLSSSRGVKRTAEQSIYDDETQRVWKNEQPVRIQTESTRRPNNVPNPYSRASSNGRISANANGSNPTARMIVTESRPGKRPKETHSPFEHLSSAFPGKYGTSSNSKYWPSNREKQHDLFLRDRRAIPSTVPASSSSSTVQRTVGQSGSGYNQQSGRSKIVAPVESELNKASTSFISIDESESEDIGVAMSRRRRLAKSESRDEIDLIDENSDNPELTSLPEFPRTSDQIRKPSSKRQTGVLDAGMRRPPSVSAFPLPRSPPPSRLAGDGESTKRLNDKLRAHMLQDASSTTGHLEIPSSSDAAPQKAGDAQRRDDEVEEIEYPDGFISTPTSSTSRSDPTTQMPRKFVRRAPSPSTSAISHGRVKRMASKLEDSKPETRHIPDLTKVGPSKSRISSMKGKNPSASNQPKTNNRTSGLRRDKHATAKTSFKNQISALPLQFCIWGKWGTTELEDMITEPEYWLVWNEDVSQLQVYKHPLPSLSPHSKKKPERSINLSALRSATISISGVSDFHLIRIKFEDELVSELSDDVQKVGLTFRVMSRHSNLHTNWEAIHTRLKSLMSEDGRTLEIVKGRGATACLKTAQNDFELYVDDRRAEKRSDPVKPTQIVPNKSTTGDEIHTPLQKKQPRPRPAHGKDQDIAQMFAGRTTRRSSRLSIEANMQADDNKQEEEVPPANSDEIILVYPPFGQGAVNVTNGDLRRLEPSEFLNDTLIELGLKFWLHDLREKQPEIADSIHVFSSFFFKKLSSKSNKTSEDSHKSVKKWTAKVDIFKKKYIIVPINENIHWYLAIIYQPEHILDPPSPKPPLRSSKRVSGAAASKQLESSKDVVMEGNKNEKTNTSGGGDDSTGEDAVNTPVTWQDDSEAEAEVEVEGLVDGSELGVERSLDQCSLEESQSKSKDVRLNSKMKGTPGLLGKETGVVDDSLSENSDDDEVDQLQDDDIPPTSLTEHSSMTPGHSSINTREPPSLSTHDPGSPMDVDGSVTDHASLRYPSSSTDECMSSPTDDQGRESRDVTRETDPVHEEKEERNQPTVPAASFYGASISRIKTYENRKRPLDKSLSNQPRQDEDADELDMLGHCEPERGSSEDIEVTESPRTIIFGMDSLGNAHPKALSRLNEYLQEEAKDKKGVLDPSSALTKKALVPAQPNFCDCGLYLLHFAQTFVSDPERYKAAIFSSKKTLKDDRNALWRNEEVGTMREKMKERILSESATWKKMKAEKEQKEQEGKAAAASGDPANQAIQEEQSDDEIEVSEVRHIAMSPKKPTKKNSDPSAPAARLR